MVETTDPSTATLPDLQEVKPVLRLIMVLIARIEPKATQGNQFEMAMETPTLTTTF